MTGVAREKGFTVSRAWKKVSGLCAVPRVTGRSGLIARRRWARTSSSSTMARICSSDSITSVLTSCEVRKPSMKRSEEHTYELQSLMRISYAVFCLKKKNQHQPNIHDE